MVIYYLFGSKDPEDYCYHTLALSLLGSIISYDCVPRSPVTDSKSWAENYSSRKVFKTRRRNSWIRRLRRLYLDSSVTAASTFLPSLALDSMNKPWNSCRNQDKKKTVSTSQHSLISRDHIFLRIAEVWAERRDLLGPNNSVWLVWS